MSMLTRYRWWFATAAFLVAFTLFTAEFQQPQTTAVLAATLRQSTPLVLGALCGILCERSGVINIGIEGQMLMSAFAGFVVASSTGDLLLGVAAGIGCGMLMGAFLAFLSVSLQSDQIIAGTV
jgi:simple sugar transport system permease protein